MDDKELAFLYECSNDEKEDNGGNISRHTFSCYVKRHTLLFTPLRRWHQTAKQSQRYCRKKVKIIES